METNKIYNENCLDTMARMPDNFVDLTVTSPPYDNLRDYKGYSFDFESIAKELYRITKEGGVVVWVVGDETQDGSESGTSFRQALYFKETGFNLHDTMIYSKNGFRFPFPNRYHQVFEYMFIFSKGKPKTFNPIKDKPNKHIDYSERMKREKDGSKTFRKAFMAEEFGKRYNIWQYAIGGDKGVDHPATFPEKLAEDHILSWSNEGDLVYDPFMGSGTTAKMAMNNKRNYIGSEISKEYCDIAENRLSKQTKVLL